MTINTEDRVAGPFAGNDSTVAFPFTFKVFAEDEVLVVAETGSVETVLVRGSDYEVALNPDQNASPGGVVTLALALATGTSLTLTSDLGYLQPVDLTNQSGFYPRVINNALDRLTILIQQLFARLSRALVFPISDGPVGEMPGAGVRAGSVLAFDENGNPIPGPTIDAVGVVGGSAAAINSVAESIEDVNFLADNLQDVTNLAGVYYGPSATDPLTRRNGAPLQEGDLYFNTEAGSLRVFDGVIWGAATSGSIHSQVFSGDGDETVFTLDASPGNKNNTQVYIHGVYQAKDQYELVGSEIAFHSAPPAGVDNIEVMVFAPLQVDPLTAQNITDLIELLDVAVRKDSASATGAAVLPAGTSSERPVGAPGLFRFNTLLGEHERYQNGKWVPLNVLDKALNEAPIVALASATTVNLGLAGANTITITGTATITSLGTIAAGATRRVVFAGALTLTHSASLILLASQDIITSAGDVAEFVSEGGGAWRCISYQRMSGQPLTVIPRRNQVSAWANFNGTGAGSLVIRSSSNIPAVIDNGTGNYTVLLSPGFPSPSAYAVVVNATDDVVSISNPDGYAWDYETDRFKVRTPALDRSIITLAVFGV